MEPRPLGPGFDGAPVEVRRTHLSEVYLTPDRAVKVKRPVDVGFCDFRDIAARRRACEAEVTLNRRLAPDVYLGVTTLPDGEPAVVMRRLRDEDSLLAWVERGALDEAQIRAVGERIATFHAETATSRAIAAHGRFDAVRANALENFVAAEATIGVAVSAAVHARGLAATERELARIRAAVDGRAESGRVRDTHGDLRLEHVYLEPRPGGGHEILVIDCVEFADRFRYADIAADLAFLVMDLGVRGRDDLGRALADAWVEATGDDDALDVLPFYVSYRSAVRGKVAGITLADPGTPPERRRTQLDRARRHWLYAWRTLAPHAERPLLVGVGGRPGTGKTTVAQGLAERCGLRVVRTDVVRKELAGIPPTTPTPDAPDRGLYAPERRDAVYDACFARAADGLFAGERIVVDGSFTSEAPRQRLVALGHTWGVRTVFLRCEAPDDVVRKRIAARTGDASDADVAVYEHLTWEPESAPIAAVTVPIDTSGSIPSVVASAVAAIPADHR